MKTKKLIYFLGFLLALFPLIAPTMTHASWWKATIPPVTQPTPETKPPIIINTFAVERAYYGYNWKIYIEAEDPDGDMSRISIIADEPGHGRLQPDWLIIKPQHRKHLKGYLQWNTWSFSGGLPEWTQVTLKVSIFDKAGNESNVAVFPFTFETGVMNPYHYKLPPPFDQGDIPRLGYINIDLNPAMGSPAVN